LKLLIKSASKTRVAGSCGAASAALLHEVPPHGTIAAIHAGAGYGFTVSSDGREICFHRNSVAEDRFDEPGSGGRGALFGVRG
jgi:hypothetical protein